MDPPSQDARQDNPTRGIIAMLAGTGLITVNDALMKWVVIDHPIGEAIFIRGIFALIPMVFLIKRAGGWRAAKWQNLRGQLLCAVLLMVPLFVFIYSLSILPLSLLTVVLYTNPLMVAGLAAWYLREQVAPSRWVAVGVGFLGTTLVIQPGSAQFTWLLLLPLLVALLGSIREVILRKLVAHETSVSVLVFSSTFVTLSAIPTAFFGWDILSVSDFALLGAAGLGFGFGIYLVTDALRYADASLVVPFKYSGVVWALGLGYLLWGETMGGIVLFGAIIVVASGLFLVRT